MSDKILLGTSIDEDTYEKICAVCFPRNLSISAYVRACIEMSFDDKHPTYKRNIMKIAKNGKRGKEKLIRSNTYDAV